MLNEYCVLRQRRANGTSVYIPLKNGIEMADRNSYGGNMKVIRNTFEGAKQFIIEDKIREDSVLRNQQDLMVVSEEIIPYE